MVAVVEIGVQRRDKAVKAHRVNAEAHQIAVVVFRQRADRTNVVVQHAHIQSGGRLLPQDVKDRIPHYAFFDDEILQKDELLCVAQLLAHGVEHFLADTEIFRLRVGPHRHTVQRLDVTGACCMTRMLLDQLLCSRCTHIVGEIRRLRLVLMLGTRPIERRIAPEQIKQAAEQRQQHNNQYPCYFVHRVVVLTHQPDDNDNAQHGQCRCQPVIFRTCPAYAEHNDCKLNQQQESADNASVAKQLAYFSAHHNLSLLCTTQSFHRL